LLAAVPENRDRLPGADGRGAVDVSLSGQHGRHVSEPECRKRGERMMMGRAPESRHPLSIRQ
jgi:hypothetical protein